MLAAEEALLGHAATGAGTDLTGRLGGSTDPKCGTLNLSDPSRVTVIFRGLHGQKAGKDQK